MTKKPNKNLKRLKQFGVLLAIAIPTFFAFKPAPRSDLFEITKNLSIFSSVYKEIDMYYVDEVEPGKFMKKGIDAMLISLDPYTNYIPESKIEDYRLMTTGEYGGIGSLIRKKGDYVVISEPYDGFPAQRADLRAGDKILEVDGKDAKGKSTSELSTLLKGQSGTKVTMVIQRGEERIEKELSREKVKIADVPYSGMIDDKVGYLSLSSFTNTASQNVGEAIRELKELGMEKLIFDLRGNGGGLLNESVNIVNFFVPRGTKVVETKGRIKEVNKPYKTHNQPIDVEMPVVVLIDGNSASASEIVSGSLQDLDRAVIVGQNSFGKGLVQQTRNIDYNAKVKITIAKYYTPSGRCIQRLDYSAHETQNKGEATADSLLTTFKTKNGRDVKDGRGIDPDIVVNLENYSRLTATLMSNDFIFDYATDFRASNESIAPAKEFTMTDVEYDKFKSYVMTHDFDYNHASGEQLEDVIELAKKEKYFEASEAEFEALKAKLSPDKAEDLERYKDELEELLENEIASRYYFQKGRIEVSMKRDPYIQEALKVLHDNEKYNAILAGKK